MQEERDKLKEKLLCKKEPGLDLRNFQPLQIAKEDKIRRFVLRTSCSEEKAHGVAGQRLANALEEIKRTFSEKAL